MYGTNILFLQGAKKKILMQEATTQCSDLNLQRQRKITQYINCQIIPYKGTS